MSALDENPPDDAGRRFVFRAKDTDGAEVADIVVADDITQARAQLEALGLTDIQFTHDTSSARLGGEVPDNVSAADYLKAREQSPREFWFQYFRSVAIVVVPLLLLDAWLLRRFPDVAWYGWVVVVVTLGFIGLLMWTARGVLIYNQMQHAVVDADWPRLLKLCERMGKLRVSTPPGTIEMYTARALIGMGRRDDAFDVFDPVGQPGFVPAVPPESHLTMRSTLHLAAGELGEYERCLREVAALTPDAASPWIDLASMLALWGGPSRRDDARAALAEGESREVVALAQVYVTWTHGILALDDGDAQAALTHLDAAILTLSNAVKTPLVRVPLAMMAGLRAAALHRVGRHAEARALWQEAAPLLQRHKLTPILARYGRAARTVESVAM